MDIKIVRCDGDSWEGLYISGKLILENYSLDVYQILKTIQGCFMSGDKPIASMYFINAEWLVEQGSLPNDFLDIPENVIEKNND